MSFCTNCGSRRTGDGLFCSKCGTKFSDELTPGRLCNNCKNDIEDGMIFCDKCGTRYEPPAPQPHPTSLPFQLQQSFSVLRDKASDKLSAVKERVTEATWQNASGQHTQEQNTLRQNEPERYAPEYTTQPNQGVNSDNALTITRSAQMSGSFESIQVSVNGTAYGNIAPGQSKTVSVQDSIAEVTVSSTTVKSLRAKLRLGQNAQIIVSMKGGVPVLRKFEISGYSGVEILETT